MTLSWASRSPVAPIVTGTADGACVVGAAEVVAATASLMASGYEVGPAFSGCRATEVCRAAGSVTGRSHTVPRHT